MNSPKISILMPTYNDEKHIRESIESVLSQTYENWELIISHQLSNDKTEFIVSEYLEDSRIKLIPRQECTGQLNALYSACDLVCGNFVTMLHSDDKYIDQNSLKNTISALITNCYDGVYGDLCTLRSDRKIGTIKTPKYVNPRIVNTIFNLKGSNIINDVFFVRSDIFKKYVIERYIIWNMPYWFSYEGSSIKVLKLLKVPPWYLYSINQENYIHSEVGKFEVLNGCLRTCIEYSKRFYMPMHKLTRNIDIVLYRFLNLNLIYSKINMTNTIDKSAIKSTIFDYYNEMSNNHYIDSLISFYDNYPSSRDVEIEREICQSDDYFGKDARIFYKDIQTECIPELHQFLINEANKGYRKVFVKDNKCRKKVEVALKFLNFLAKVEIR
ncbi:MAG: glycosyltransferase family 2 protein [Methanomicrobiales archaeon]|nr:glycosyltransferase family 2 protein [Methanomicrobiales archaeon]MDI6877633.1 glycosyltransferase family 2 protein [Methanomicrobiales archaeon]